MLKFDFGAAENWTHDFDFVDLTYAII